MEPLLAALPPGSTVAVVTMRGSLCPITLGHVRCFQEARALLLQLAHAECVVGFAMLNGDHHLAGKFAGKAEKPLSLAERSRLVELATAELPWLERSASRPHSEMARLHKLFPALRLQHWDMNGADDVVKYRKYQWASPENKMIVMCRPGSTEELLSSMAKAGSVPCPGTSERPGATKRPFS